MDELELIQDMIKFMEERSIDGHFLEWMEERGSDRDELEQQLEKIKEL